MADLPDLSPLANADITLWAIRRNSRWLCTSANNLCNAVDRLDDLPSYDTEAEAALNNAITAMEFALSAATEKRNKLISQRAVRKVMRIVDEVIGVSP